MIVDAKVLSLISAFMVHSVSCGGGGGHSVDYIHAEYPYHTHHQHHTEKIPEIKIIKVPVVKEIKIPHPYKVHYKVRVPYIVKQEIHTVPVHTHPIHSSEHIHHGPSHSGSGYGSGFGSGFSSGSSSSFGSGSSFGGQGFTSHGASSNVAPMFASHTPVAMTSQSMFSQQSTPKLMQVVSPKSVQQSAQQNQIVSAPKGVQQSASQQNQGGAVNQHLFQNSSPLYMTGLNTMIQASAGGFKTQEWGSSGSLADGYQVREAGSDTGPAVFSHSNGGIAQAGSSKSIVAYPYPFQHQNEKNPFEYSFGFKPSDPLYGF